MPDCGLTSLAAKGTYTIDALLAPVSRGHLVASKSFGNFVLLGIGNFVSLKVRCVCGLWPWIVYIYTHTHIDIQLYIRYNVWYTIYIRYTIRYIFVIIYNKYVLYIFYVYNCYKPYVFYFSRNIILKRRTQALPKGINETKQKRTKKTWMRKNWKIKKHIQLRFKLRLPFFSFS